MKHVGLGLVSVCIALLSASSPLAAPAKSQRPARPHVVWIVRPEVVQAGGRAKLVLAPGSAASCLVIVSRAGEKSVTWSFAVHRHELAINLLVQPDARPGPWRATARCSSGAATNGSAATTFEVHNAATATGPLVRHRDIRVWLLGRSTSRWLHVPAKITAGRSATLTLAPAQARDCTFTMSGPSGNSAVSWRFATDGMLVRLSFKSHADAKAGSWMAEADCTEPGNVVVPLVRRLRVVGSTLAGGTLVTHRELRVALRPPVGKLLAIRALPKRGGVVRAKNGVTIAVPPHVLQASAWVTIAEVKPKQYDIHIWGPWHGLARVTFPTGSSARARTNVLLHRVHGSWGIQSAQIGELSAEVGQLSIFGTAWDLLKHNKWVRCLDAIRTIEFAPEFVEVEFEIAVVVCVEAGAESLVEVLAHRLVHTVLPCMPLSPWEFIKFDLLQACTRSQAPPPPPTTPTPTTTTTTTTPSPSPSPSPPPPPPPAGAAVSVSKGASVNRPDCTDPSCAYVDVSYSGFSSGSHHIQCYSDVDSGPGPFYEYDTSDTTSAVCYFGYPGRSVWVTVDGVSSGHLTW